jgi:hypothetical protein
VVTLGPMAQATLVTMNHWILTLLDPTNINMPHILYDKKIPRDKNILQKYKIETN